MSNDWNTSWNTWSSLKPGAIGIPYCGSTDWAIRSPRNYRHWLENSTIPWHNHFRNNLGFKHTKTLGLLKSFSTSFFTPSYYYYYLLALIVLKFHSLHPLSGDNLVICYLSLWEVCRNLYDNIFKIEHVLPLTSRLKVNE
jgi:hypothetical protein